MTYPVYVSDQKFENCVDLLLIADENKSHYVYIKDFNKFMRNKTKNRNKKYFCKCHLQCFSSEKVLIEHKENCLIINGKQGVKLISGSIRFKNYFKQLAVSFKIYSDFECLFEQYQYHIPSSFAYKVAFVDNKLSEKVVLYRAKNEIYRFIEAILKEYDYCKKVIKKHFDKNLIMSAKDEERF